MSSNLSWLFLFLFLGKDFFSENRFANLQVLMNKATLFPISQKSLVKWVAIMQWCLIIKKLEYQATDLLHFCLCLGPNLVILDLIAVLSILFSARVLYNCETLYICTASLAFYITLFNYLYNLSTLLFIYLSLSAFLSLLQMMFINI